MLHIYNTKSNYPPCEEFVTVRDNNKIHGKYSSIMRVNRNIDRSMRPSNIGRTNNEVILIV